MFIRRGFLFRGKVKDYIMLSLSLPGVYCHRISLPCCSSTTCSTSPLPPSLVASGPAFDFTFSSGSEADN